MREHRTERESINGTEIRVLADRRRRPGRGSPCGSRSRAAPGLPRQPSRGRQRTAEPRRPHPPDRPAERGPSRSRLLPSLTTPRRRRADRGGSRPMLEPTAIATTAAATADRDRIHDEVRARYAEAAIAAGAGRSDSEAAASCCDTHGNATFGQILYDADERAQLPDA